MIKFFIIGSGLKNIYSINVNANLNTLVLAKSYRILVNKGNKDNFSSLLKINKKFYFYDKIERISPGNDCASWNRLSFNFTLISVF